MLRLRWRRRQPQVVRIAAFIDGFNVYHGMRDKGLQRFYWLNYRALMAHFVRPGEELVAVKYFTSRVTKPLDSRNRQATYLAALHATGGVEIIEGTYQPRPMKCPDCGHRWPRPQEKMTDVALATHLITGAMRDEYDVAIIVCADADLIPAVRQAKDEGKRVIIVSPRGRTSDDLAAEGDAHLHYTLSALGRSQLPARIELPDGTAAERPPSWV